MDPLKNVLITHPLIKTNIIKGQDEVLFDDTGNKYIDFESGMWCAILGHNNQEINEVIYKQLELICHLNPRLTNTVPDRLSDDLCEILKLNNCKSIFLSSGSEAIEFSLRIAKTITGRSKIASFDNSYFSAYGFANNYNDNPNWTTIPMNRCMECNKKICDPLCDVILAISFNELAAFIFDPGCAAGSVIFPPEKVVRQILIQLKKNAVITIIDEITTGFGRTGKWFGHFHYKIKPDMVCMGKALGNGYPISAVTMKKEIAKEIEKTNLFYVQSHQNDPMGCAIGRAVISIIKKENLVERSQFFGSVFLRLAKLLGGNLKEIRGKGLMIAIELNYPNKNASEEIANRLFEKGFFIGYNSKSNTLRFMPPININDHHIYNLLYELNMIFKYFP